MKKSNIKPQYQSKARYGARDQKSKNQNDRMRRLQSKRQRLETVPNDQMDKSLPLEAHAVGRYLRISPTKVRGVLDLIRGETVEEAKRILRFSPKRGAKIALKVLDSAVANVKAEGKFEEENWVVADARADKGPLFRRKPDPKARGARGLITTPSTHLKIVIRQPRSPSLREGVAGGEPVVSSRKNEKMANEKMSKLPTKSRSAGRKEAKGGS